MSSETSLTYLNENQPYGEGYTILVVLPLHLPQEAPEYLIYINPEETVLDLKTILSTNLSSQPSVQYQKVIFRGRVLDNQQKFSTILSESESERLHFHVVINNLRQTTPLTTTRPSTTRTIPTAQDIINNVTNPPTTSHLSQPSSTTTTLQNSSLELNHEALRNYLQCIRPNLPSNLSTLEFTDQPIYYQFVSVNGQAYLVSVPGSAVRTGLTNNTAPTTTPPTPPGLPQPFHRRAWSVLMNIWPSLWLAAKLIFFYTFLSSGSSLYKQIFLGIVAALIFAFQHGVIDIQIEVVRNQAAPAPANPPVPQADGDQPDQPLLTPDQPTTTVPPSPSPPLHPVLEGLRSFLYSLFPARDPPAVPAADDPRQQW